MLLAPFELRASAVTFPMKLYGRARIRFSLAIPKHGRRVGIAYLTKPAMVAAMAKKTETVVTLTDDLDGTKADRTISFAFDGASYEIELSKKNASAFEKAMQPYVAVARKARAGATRGRSASTSSRARSRSDLTEIREWAKAQGIDVSERGRIAQTVQDAYDAAH